VAEIVDAVKSLAAFPDLKVMVIVPSLVAAVFQVRGFELNEEQQKLCRPIFNLKSGPFDSYSRKMMHSYAYGLIYCKYEWRARLVINMTNLGKST